MVKDWETCFGICPLSPSIVCLKIIIDYVFLNFFLRAMKEFFFHESDATSAKSLTYLPWLVSRETQQLRPDVRNTTYINYALQVYAALNSNNFVRFFRLVRGGSFLCACIMHRCVVTFLHSCYIYIITSDFLRWKLNHSSCRIFATMVWLGFGQI